MLGRTMQFDVSEGVELLNRWGLQRTGYAKPKLIDRALPERQLGSRKLMKEFAIYDYVDMRTVQFSQTRTALFLHEIIQQGRNYRDTTLYAEIMSGKRISRRMKINGEIKRVAIDSGESFRIYYDRCLQMFDYAKRYGIGDNSHVPWSTDLAALDDGRRDNIGVAIGDEGHLFHYRTGHHRLAFAQALGINSVPITVLVVSSAFLRAHNRWKIK